MTANLPPHIADSFNDLGFDLDLGELLPLDTPKASKTLEGKKRLAANIAKAARKERKGERRTRGSEVAVKSRSDSKKDTGKAIASKARDKDKSKMPVGAKNGRAKTDRAKTKPLDTSKQPARKPAGKPSGGKAIAKQPTAKKPGMKGGLKRGALSARSKQK